MRSRLNPLPSLVTATLLLAVTSPLPMAANPLGDRDTTVQNSNADREAHAERQQREQRIQQSQEAKAEQLMQQGIQQYHNRKFPEALATYQQILAIRRSMVDAAGEASALHNIGTIYFYLGQTDHSLKFLQEALAIRQKIGDKAGEKHTLSNINRLSENIRINEPSQNIFKPLGPPRQTSGTGEVNLIFEDDEKQAAPPPSPR